MKLPSEVLNTLGGTWDQASSTETFELAEWRITGIISSVPDASYLRVMLGDLPTRDFLKLTLVLEGDPVSFVLHEPNSIEEFVSECRAQLAVAQTPAQAILTVTVTKSIYEQTVSLYSATAFASTLQNKRLSERWATFSKVCASGDAMWVQTFDSSHAFQTRTLFFSKLAPSVQTDLKRSELLSKRSDLCHSDYSKYRFLPDDFYLFRRSSDSELNTLFDELCIASSLTFLADVTWQIAPKGAESMGFKWNGYKVVTGVFELGIKRSDNVAAAWQTIYEWVYLGGGIADKLGLARNIMSLHWKGSISDLVESGVLDSIRSSYEIYLRQNVRQYIETKNKLTEYLMDYNSKAAKLGEGLAEKFEKNVTAFVSFAITSILAKILMDKSFTGIINKPVAIIGLLLVTGSLLHLILTTFIFTKDLRRMEKEWDALESRYSDVLNSVDLRRIVQNAGGFSPIKKHLQFKKNLFVTVWSALLLLILGAILALTDWQIQSNPTPKIDVNHSSTNAEAMRQ